LPVQDAAPVSGVFPADVSLHLLEIEIQAIQLICHIARVPQRLASYA
jgi:hypothetical protein